MVYIIISHEIYKRLCCMFCIGYIISSSWIHVILASDTCHHDDVIKWKHFPRYWPFVRGIHRSPVNSPHKGQWRGALMFSLICVWIDSWVNNREAGDLRRYRAHYDVTVMIWYVPVKKSDKIWADDKHTDCEACAYLFMFCILVFLQHG